MLTNYEELEKLAQLKEKGILSNEEFEMEKKRILESNVGSSINNNNFSNNSMNYNSLSTYYEREGTFGEFFFTSKGRINRSQFLLALIGHFIYMILMLVLMWFTRELIGDTDNEVLLILQMLITVGSAFLFGYSIFIVNIKRLHDLDISGWLSIITVMLAPFSTLFLLLIPGTNGDNKYGPQR